MSRLSKDQDTLDNELALTLNTVCNFRPRAFSTPDASPVPNNLQLCSWHCSFNFLHFSLPWNHFRSHGGSVSDRIDVLSANICRNEATGLPHAFAALLILHRVTNRASDNKSLWRELSAL